MKVVIIGVRKGQTKNGRDFWNYFFKKDFTQYDVVNSECLGEMTGTEFSYVNYNLKPGDVCDFQYEPGFNDRATLSDVIPIQYADKVNAKEQKS